jgi:hypothetical protein
VSVTCASGMTRCDAGYVSLWMLVEVRRHNEAARDAESRRDLGGRKATEVLSLQDGRRHHLRASRHHPRRRAALYRLPRVLLERGASTASRQCRRPKSQTDQSLITVCSTVRASPHTCAATGSAPGTISGQRRRRIA